MSSFLRLFSGVTGCAGGERSGHGEHGGDGGGHVDDGVDNSGTGGGLDGDGVGPGGDGGALVDPGAISQGKQAVSAVTSFP